ncbi:hypothetical protein N0V88_000778 [Collariella sp. IMI 366227]|nr:hypothetical protein N0V88_000778 [Collariella sp. IMI 366227]
MNSNSSKIYDDVRKHYSSASRTTSVKYGETVAKSFGYSADELANIPQDANLGLSCGNPFAIASLKEGETVIDLGSGAGFDIFLAATKVGHACPRPPHQSPPALPTSHISFLKANITSIPFPDASADCLISNCVINLVPTADKPAVFREMYRLLKPGGRVAVSDILAKKELPEDLRRDVALYVGCVAGASEVREYEEWLKGCGFDAAAPPPASAGCCGPAKSSTALPSGLPAPSSLLSGETDLNEFVGSYKIFAVKN